MDGATRQKKPLAAPEPEADISGMSTTEVIERIKTMTDDDFALVARSVHDLEAARTEGLVKKRRAELRSGSVAPLSHTEVFDGLRHRVRKAGQQA
jgi:hypothetical protein